VTDATDGLLLAECVLSEALLEPPFNDIAPEYFQAHTQQVEQGACEIADDPELAAALSYIYAAKTLSLVITTGSVLSEEAMRLGERASELGISIPSPYDVRGTSDGALCTQVVAEFAR